MGFRFGSCYVQFPAGAMSNRGNGSGCVESALDGGAAERFMAKAKNRAALLQATKRPAPPKATAEARAKHRQPRARQTLPWTVHVDPRESLARTVQTAVFPCRCGRSFTACKVVII